MIGSIWHRWDLHYHTPSSDDYKKPTKTNEYIVNELISDGVSGVVVTDHHRIDFNRISELNRIANGQIVFLRGIEITSELGGNESVHFIVIFPDKLQEDVIRDSFLAPLGITEEKTLREPILFHQAISYSLFIQKAKDLGALISVHAGKKSNSIENIKNWCQTKQDFKKDLLEKIDILETGNKEDIPDYNDVVFTNIGKVCPVVVCSDYHAEFNYREYLNNKTTPPQKLKRDATWIKSELTFDGLKQIVYEPSLRVKVQEINPSNSKFGIQLNEMRISKTNLFNENKLFLNQDMVAVIGEKGSGKTALLDFIAHVLGVKLEDKVSFLNRAKCNLKNTAVTFKLYKGVEQSCDINNPSPTRCCKYINPTFLAELLDENNDELQNYIRNIFEGDAIQENDQTSLNLLEAIKINISKIERLQSSINTKSELIRLFETVKINLQNLQKTKPEAKGIDTVILDQHATLTKAFNEENQKLTICTSRNTGIIYFNTLREQKLEEIKNKALSEIQNDLINTGFPNKVRLNIEFSNDTITELDKYQEQLEKDKATQSQKVHDIEIDLKKLDNVLYASKEQMERFEKWKKEFDTLTNESQRLTNELKIIEELEKEQIGLRKEIYLHYCCLLNNKKAALKLYTDLQEKIMDRVGNVGNSKLEFFPKIDFNIEKLFSNMDKYLSFRSLDQELVKDNISKKYYLKFKSMFDDNNLVSVEKIEPLLNLIINADENLYEKQLTSKSFKQGYNILSLLNVAFDDYFTISYEIRFNQMPIEQLSAGQKGIVLIKLLLRLDNSNEPLLIDQPEDNLDNKSVYEELVCEFKEIKQKRQLIIATHNPNLVVNTDAEQIVIAKYNRSKTDGFISYIGGALEDKNIRDEVCKILEGGKDAFVMREKKYDFVKD